MWVSQWVSINTKWVSYKTHLTLSQLVFTLTTLFVPISNHLNSYFLKRWFQNFGQSETKFTHGCHAYWAIFVEEFTWSFPQWLVPISPIVSNGMIKI